MEEDPSSKRYTFLGEWREVENCKVTEFIITYFGGDGSLELFDVKKHRLFLKRTKCHQVTLADLFIGNSVNILSRQITITDYGDRFTRQCMSVKMQKTFSLIKPDQIENLGPILEAIHEGGFILVRMVMIQMTKEQAVNLYKDFESTAQLSDMVSHVISGPVVAMELLGNNAIQSWFDFLGSLDPEEARKNNPTSLVGRYGRDSIKNGFHASGNLEETERLLSIFFPEKISCQLKALSPVASFTNSTCCIVKPHAFQAGLLGPIITAIQKSGYKVTGLRVVLLDHSAAEEFLEIYNGILPEYPAMVTQLCSGSCVALEVSGKDENTSTEFRELVGPSDPEIAKKIRPSSLRARFGTNRILNAIHCTDLPDDAILELEYFFKLL